LPVFAISVSPLLAFSNTTPPMSISAADEHEQFKRSVAAWIQLGPHLTEKNQELKRLRDEKHELETQIFAYMTKHGVLDKPIKLNKTGSDRLVVTTKRETGALTFKYVEECLEKILSTQEEVDYILDVLHDQRPVKETSKLERITEAVSGASLLLRPASQEREATR
jgi:hypothetical protein